MFFTSRLLPLITCVALIISASACSTATEAIPESVQDKSQAISKSVSLPLGSISTDDITSVEDINPNVGIFNQGLKTYSEDLDFSLIDFDIMEPDMNEMPSGFTSNTCAMDLEPVAKNIYASISPKVQKDTNLRKLMKKEIRPQVFSGKLSVKSARENAQAASKCLSLLKAESGEI